MQEAPERCSRISQNHFSNHFVNIHVHQDQGHAPEPSTILKIIPSDEITHAGTIEISRSDSSPNLRCMAVAGLAAWLLQLADTANNGPT